MFQKDQVDIMTDIRHKVNRVDILYGIKSFERSNHLVTSAGESLILQSVELKKYLLTWLIV